MIILDIGYLNNIKLINVVVLFEMVVWEVEKMERFKNKIKNVD